MYYAMLFTVLSILGMFFFFFFSSRRRHTRCLSDWSSDVCSSDLEERQVVGVERDAFARVAAEEPHRGTAGGRPLLNGVLEAPHIGVTQPVQRATAVIASDQLIVRDGNYQGTSLRNLAEQQPTDLRTARSQRAETLHGFSFQPIDQAERDPHRHRFLRDFPKIEGGSGSLHIKTFRTRRRLSHRNPPPV